MLGIEGVFHKGVVGYALLRALPGNSQGPRNLVVARLQILAGPWFPSRELRTQTRFIATGP